MRLSRQRLTTSDQARSTSSSSPSISPLLSITTSATWRFSSSGSCAFKSALGPLLGDPAREGAFELLVAGAVRDHEHVVGSIGPGLHQQRRLHHCHRDGSQIIEPTADLLPHQRVDGPFESETEVAVPEHPAAEDAAVDAAIAVEDRHAEDASHRNGPLTPRSIEIVDDGIRVEYRDGPVDEDARYGRLAGSESTGESDHTRPLAGETPLGGQEVVPNSEFRIPNSLCRPLEPLCLIVGGRGHHAQKVNRYRTAVFVPMADPGRDENAVAGGDLGLPPIE